MGKGIVIDRQFLIHGKAASAQEVLNTLKPALPKWFFAAFKAENGRIILGDAKGITEADRRDPEFKNWEQIYHSIRDASDAGEWRLMSALTVDKATEGGKGRSALQVDQASGKKPITRGGRELELSISDDSDFLGWTGVSEARQRSIEKQHPGAETADEDLEPVDGNEGIAVISTRQKDGTGAVTQRGVVEIGFTILHELAAHAGLATAAGQSPQDNPDWKHHAVKDLGERPSDAIERFLDERRAAIVPKARTVPIVPGQEVRKGFFERFHLFHLRLPNIGGIPDATQWPSRSFPNRSYQEQLRQQQRRQLQQQQEREDSLRMQRDQLQQQLQRAAQQRALDQQQMLREQQRRQAQDQRNRDQARLQDMLRRQNEQRQQQLRQAQDQRNRDQARLQDLLRRQNEQRQQQARQDAIRRATEDQQRRQREQNERNQRRMQEAMRQSQVSSRPSTVYAAATRQPFVSPKLWETSKPQTMTLPPKIYSAPPPKPYTPPAPSSVSPPFSRPNPSRWYS